MPPLNLLGGSYKSQSVIANAQRCVNLFPENMPQKSQSAAPTVHYMRPGLRRLVQAPAIGLGRGLYTASNGDLYCVIGPNVYFVSNNWVMTQIGTIALGTSIVSLYDNGTDILMVDGSAAGYLINLTTRVMTTIVNPAFYGANRVDYAGTAFILNRPGTPQFYISGPNATTFDPLDFGQKTSSPDPLVAVACLNNQVWLMGMLKGEVWYYSGAADFPFQLLQGVQIEHGLRALYSIATTDKFMFWLTRDKDGDVWVAKGGTDYAVKRVSTHAIENEIQSYANVADAIGYTEQFKGHTFYVLNFPSADKTWAYDLATDEWHERATLDNNGNLHRGRPQLQQFAYGKNVVIDWQRGDLLEASLEYYSDDGTVFPCIRSFPQLISNMNRVSYRCFTANVEVGEWGGPVQGPWSSGFGIGFGPLPQTTAPLIYLRQSIDRGKTFQDARGKSMGGVGEYDTVPQWRRLSMARGSVFELSWAANAKASLVGAFLEDPEQAET